MQKKVKLLILIFSLIPMVFASAQEYRNETKDNASTDAESAKDANLNILAPKGAKVGRTKQKLSPGMELIEFGEVNIVAPKGTKVYRDGSKIIFEDFGEYVARRLDEIEKRFEKLEEKQLEIKKDIEQLKKVVDQIYKRSLTAQ